jgi:hypothetical protein
MATPIRIKRSAVPNKRPTLADLQLGEPAINTFDGRIYLRRDTGVASTITLVTPWTENTGGSIYYNDGNIGVGTTNPTSKLTVFGDALLDGVVTATTFSGQINAGVATVTSLSIGSTQVISSGRQLQNILSLDSITVATIESAISNAPNTFSDITVTGISTLGVTSATSLRAQQLNVSGITTLGVVTAGNIFSTGIITANTFVGNLTGNVTGNLNSSGVNTATTLSGTTATYTTGNFTTANITTGIVTTLIGTNLNYSGIGTITTLNSTNAILTNINSSGISTLGVTSVTRLTSQSINSSGIVTGSTFRPSTGYIQAADGTNSFYIYNSTGNVAFQGTIGASQINNAQGYKVIGFAGTNNTTFENHVYISGVTTSIGGFVGNLTGTATTATNLSDAANITTGIISTSRLSGTYNINISGNAATATYATNAGIATYATSSGIATYASTSGIATYATSSGIATYASIAGIATYATNAGIATYSETAGIATYATNAGIATYATNAGIATYATSSGIATYASISGIATYATSLQNVRTFEITGDIIASPISFDGTGNVSLAATIQPNSVGLGTDTFGDYVKDISGTANQITVTSGTGEGSTPIISIPDSPILPGNVTISNDLQVNNNLNVSGNITIGGTSAVIFVNELNVKDKEIVLGITTINGGVDRSTDTTANHGGIAIASTEGSPLVSMKVSGINTLPDTYKQLMWVKSGTMGAGTTGAWIFNYAVGVGSTQVPNGIRFAAGSVQFTENDLLVIRNINASGIITASSFSGNASSATYATSAGIATYATSSGIATYSETSGIATYATSSGIATYATTAGIATYASTAGIATYATSVGIATYATSSGIATYSETSGISTNVIGGIGSLAQLSVSGIATIITELDVGVGGTIFNALPTGFIGIGTTNPTSKLYIVGDTFVTGVITSTDYNSASDIKLKTNISTILNPLDKVSKLNGVEFTWKETGKKSAGVIAQEVEKVLPNLVNGDETKTVNYNGLIGLLIECIKEQQKEIDFLKQNILS